MSIQAPPRKFTVAEYHQMIQAGVLAEDDRVELIEGWIVAKMPHNPPHDSGVNNARQRIERLLPAGWETRIQSAITLPDSEPEPDIVVVPSPASRYSTHHPGPLDIALLVEVADSSLARDRGEKCRSYARAGIVCYWIINLVQRQVEVYTDPTGPVGQPAYRRRTDYGSGDSVPLVIGGQQIALIPVGDLLV